MGSPFRSEEMVLCQLFLPSEAAYNCVAELGELGLVQFRDLNPEVNNFQRRFVSDVHRCSEMERRLCYVQNEMAKAEVPIRNAEQNLQAPGPREMINLEETFEDLEADVKDVNQKETTLNEHYLELIELGHVLAKSRILIDEQKGVISWTEPSTITSEGKTGPVQLDFVAGVVPRERMPAFERMVFRVGRGNAFLRQVEIESPVGETDKNVFMIFFSGDQLHTKMMKICDGFHATVYPCPEDMLKRREMYMNLVSRIENLVMVIEKTRSHRIWLLMAAARFVKSWLVKVRKMKAIYHALNLFNSDFTRNCLIAECWVPVIDIDSVSQALRIGSARSDSFVPAIMNQIHTVEEPPTFIRLNKVTRGFQALIDAYGVPTYREINPMPYTIITFPFLFSVMFGDLGHGALMFLFAVWMVIREKSLMKLKTENEIWKIFFGGRYIILLMGLFSMYTGFIYNDVFSKSVNLFGSHWKVNYNSYTLASNKHLQLDPKYNDYVQTPYPIGLDPIWQLAENKIVFLNSYKMKMSIIIGVIHMLFGVSLSMFNSIFFKKRTNIITEFIPQVIFLVFLFAYLVLLMFIKWVKYSAANKDASGSNCAPSVLITFINMLLFKPGTPNNGCSEFMFAGQEVVQKFLVLSAVLCIPWMLLAKPILLMRKRKREALMKERIERNRDLESGEAMTDDKNVAIHEEPISEVFVHQGIHTIEYVLGSVSHTASYLRLWALSLAHSQLSEVLWIMILQQGFHAASPMGGVILFASFAFWAILTVGILVLMEGLSAFLHTLRLHWVEFQSKFYGGLGYGFQPFSFEILCKSDC